MRRISNDTFGSLIAYLVPGATALAGLALYLPAVHDWFAAARTDAPALGGFLCLTVASLTAGMTVSAVRWAVVDRLHACNGLTAPDLNFARLPGRDDGLRLLIEIRYRHYQFYTNMLVAVAIAYVAHRLHAGLS